MTTATSLDELDPRTRELVRSAKLGNEVLLMEADMPVAQIVALTPQKNSSRIKTALKYPTFSLGAKGPLPSRSELAEEMFDRG